MLDIKLIRANTTEIKQALARRGTDYSEQIDKALKLDDRRKELIGETEKNKARQNEVSKKIPQMKKAGEDTTEIMAEMKAIADSTKELDAELSEIDANIREILLYIPNAPHESVPSGKDEHDNVEMSKSGTPREFEFEPLPHWEIGKNLGILDPDTAAKVTGARFHFYVGLGARLERAIINFYLDTHASRGYTEVFPPFIANKASMTGTGQLPKFADDMFKLEGNDYYLIPTAEVPLTNIYRDDIIEGAKLPIKFAAYSACFRAEAGSAGRDTRGLIRQHQFNKVELVKFAKQEESFNELESLRADAEFVLSELGLAHRTVLLCAGDMGAGSQKTYDIEVWLPSYGRYAEISSCSNFGDYQARRAGIRYKNSPTEKAQLVHTLNGSGVAIGRTVAAILENYQNGDGSVTVPEKLRPYMGCDVIKKA